MKTNFERKMYTIFILAFSFFTSVPFCDQAKIQTSLNQVRTALVESELQRKVPFLSHNEDFPYGKWLGLNVNFKPADRIRKAIAKITNLDLKARGEAHITVLTPPEFDSIQKFRPEFSMPTLEEITASWIQHAEWKSLGIGSAKAKNPKGVESEVFFLVVESKTLRALRKMIACQWDLPKNVFDPMAQDFHITLGFTHSDLHSQPGRPIYKDERSLRKDLSLEKLASALDE